MTEDVKTIIKNLVLSLGVELEEVFVEAKNGGITRFCVRTKDSNLLIGKQGQNFTALNHIVKKIVSKTYPDAQFLFDINDYQNQNIEALRNKAVLMAERAKSFQTNIEMEPMSSYERMIIHSSLTEVSNIKTNSIGDGPSRRVVIMYVGDQNSPLV